LPLLTIQCQTGHNAHFNSGSSCISVLQRHDLIARSGIAWSLALSLCSLALFSRYQCAEQIWHRSSHIWQSPVIDLALRHEMREAAIASGAMLFRTDTDGA
jgi:hypothetical protein